MKDAQLHELVEHYRTELAEARADNERQRKLIEELYAGRTTWWRAKDIAESALAEARAEVERLDGLVYVPGLWKCAKCNFQLTQANLNANDGSVTARDEPGDKCPNCDVPLWRVTERDAGNEMVDRCIENLDRATAAEAARDKAETERDAMRAVAEAATQTTIARGMGWDMDGALDIQDEAVRALEQQDKSDV